MSTNPFISFLQEIFLRFSAKSPKFFQIWQWVSGAVAAITGLPSFLQSIGVNLPSPLDALTNKTVAICGVVAFFMSAMTTQSKTIGVDQNGTPIKQTNADKLPFTTNQEIKKAGDVEEVVLPNPASAK